VLSIRKNNIQLPDSFKHVNLTFPLQIAAIVFVFLTKTQILCAPKYKTWRLLKRISILQM
jgi:hypothetical protein